jgi:hypothetical protein
MCERGITQSCTGRLVRYYFVRTLALPTGYTTSYGPLNPRIGRWFIRLSEFNYKIEYQKGDQNKGRRKAPVLKVGDLVLVRAKIPATGGSRKLYPKFKSRLSASNFRLSQSVRIVKCTPNR